MKKQKQILIVSIDGDMSTDKVMDWLYHFGYSVIRHNTDTDYFNSYFSFQLGLSTHGENLSITINNKSIKLNEIKSVWFRKYSFPLFENWFKMEDSSQKLQDDLIHYLKHEFSSSNFALFNTLIANKKHLGGRITQQPTKMEMLLKAREFGIEIPNTIITNLKAELKRFFEKNNKKIITKSIKDGTIFNKKDHKGNYRTAISYTESIDEDIMKKIPQYFFPSLFQEKLNKEFEIRSFYLDGNFYSSAIFSQLDKQTDVDFRMYNNKRPNRIIPYNLPKKLQSQLERLMCSLNLKSGSLDLIKTKNGKIVFLEVNPWGQYGMISVPCNFKLDKIIAEYLIK